MFAQQPVAGVTAVKGTTVILSVSSGVQRVTVPAVVGQTQGAAVTQLTALGLKPQLMNVPSTQPAGQVIAQNPAPGAKVDKGSTVALNVSSGSGGGTTTTTTTTRVTVPDVVGQDQASASSAIRQAGLTPLVRFQKTTDQTQDGTVIVEQPGRCERPQRLVRHDLRRAVLRLEELDPPRASPPPMLPLSIVVMCLQFAMLA